MRCLWAKRRSRGGRGALGSGLLRGEIMAGILDLIPEIGKLLDRFVPDPAKKLEAERMMKELDIRELEARMGVQKAWLSNNSLFVSGAIPSVLWTVVVVIVFNHILAPLLKEWITIPTLALPEWYANLAATIVLGLFGKKAWDSSEIHWKDGQILKTAKDKTSSPSKKAAVDMTPREIDARLLEICKEKGIEP
jgi:hypothetical protein